MQKSILLQIKHILYCKSSTSLGPVVSLVPRFFVYRMVRQGKYVELAVFCVLYLPSVFRHLITVLSINNGPAQFLGQLCHIIDLGGSVGCASRVQPPPRLATFLRGD